MNQNRILTRIFKFFFYFILAWILFLAILQFIVSERNLTDFANEHISEYVEGDVRFGKVSLSFFRHFPKIRLDMENVSITYPTEQFLQQEQEGIQDSLIKLGKGELIDTLAAFEKFSVSINSAALLWGNIRINEAELTKPRIFLHQHADGSANWDIVKLKFETEEEDEEFTLPNITFGKIKMYNKPLLVYTDSRDTIFAIVQNKTLEFNGKIATNKGWSDRIGLDIKDLSVAGKYKQDSLRFGLHNLAILKDEEEIKLGAKSKIDLATKSFGRLTVPIDVDGLAYINDKKFRDIELAELKVSIAEVPFLMFGNFKFHEDSLEVKAQLSANDIDLNEILRKYGENIHSETSEIETNIKMDLYGKVDGAYIYETEALPHFKFNLTIPNSEISHRELAKKMELDFKMDVENDNKGKINVNIPLARAYGSGTHFDATAKAKDITGDDPLFSIKLDADSHLDSLMWLVPHELYVTLKGDIQAKLDGQAKLSQLDIYKFSGAKIDGTISSNHFEVYSDSLGIDSMVDSLTINLKTIKNPYKSADKRDDQLLEINVSVDSTDIFYKDSIKFSAKNLYLRAQNSAKNIDMANKTRVHPMGGRIMADRLRVSFIDSTRIALRNTTNQFMIAPSKNNIRLPNITLNSNTERLFYRDIDNRVIARQANIDLFAEKLSHQKSQSLVEYYKDWDVSGMVNLNSARIITKHLPLSNRVSDFSGSFNNDNIKLNQVYLQSGDSELEVTGELSDLKNAITNNGDAKLKLNIFAPKLLADELILAYMSGLNATTEAGAALSDEEFQKAVLIDTLDKSQLPSYIVVPDNIDCDIHIEAYDIEYLTLRVDWINSDIKIKDRCAQLTDFVANSNMGDMHLNGFYATRSKEDIKAGFNLDLTNVTARNAIELMPVIDSLMPLIKTFDGMLNCGISATTNIDTTMSIVIPSITGAMRLSGYNLFIKDNPDLRSLAKTLMFKDKKYASVDELKINGVLTRGAVNLFPFRLLIDRYNLAVSGKQNLDMSYYYHLSVLKSPLPFRIGIDITGKDFDNMNMKITKAKYKNVYPQLYDPVVKAIEDNLKSAIRDVFKTGVDEVITQNESISGM